MKLESRGLYIDGDWLKPAEDEWTEISSPATESGVGTAPVGSALDAGQAITAARRAFDSGPWPRLSPAERTELMRRFQAELRALADEAADACVWEAGIVRSGAIGSCIPVAEGHLEFAIEECSRDLVETLPVVDVPQADGSTRLGTGVVAHEPIGVVAAIIPFNSPYQVSVAKVGPAIATGNTVVLKPSPYTPFGSLLIGEAAARAGLPAGVVNVVTGGEAVGARLVESPDVDMVTFTGSDTVGALVAQAAAPTLKKVVLELGGKSAQIVLADADIAAAAASGTANFTSFAGQGCSLRTRHLVHESIVDEYTEAIAAACTGLAVGDPDSLETEMGPLINARQRERVEGFISRGVAAGARVVCGGGRPVGLERGFYLEPTVIDGIDNGDEIAQREVFGPVSVVIPFSTDEEAAALANASDFGLGGAVWSRDLGRAMKLARRFRTGQVHLNGGPGMQINVAPFGGIKRSGMGREYGREGLLEYTETKFIGLHAG